MPAPNKSSLLRRSALLAPVLALVMVAPMALAGEDAWSRESGGLQARLALRRAYVFNGTGMVEIHLELRNATGVTGDLRVTVDGDSMAFRVTDAAGDDAPPAFGSFSGFAGGVHQELILPADGAARYRIGPTGWGVPPDLAALVDLGPNFGWFLPHDGKSYVLHGTLEAEVRRDGNRSERCRLELPPVQIPTTSEPFPGDDAALGKRIDELGALMLSGAGRESEAAMRALSLIDDPRAVPWYVQAAESDSYSLRFEAMSRLARFDGDAALAGLKVGMQTQGEHIGNASKPSVADTCAANIRLAALRGLERSEHPAAGRLVFAMQDDPSPGVRITLSQALARMAMPDARAALERLAQDDDEQVRREAQRLVDQHANGKQ